MKMVRVPLLLMVTLAGLASSAGAQLSENLSNAERLLLFRAGTGRVSNRTFARYAIAADLINQSDRFLSQDSARQRNARLRALQNQRALENLMRTGESAPSAGRSSDATANALANSNVLQVWNAFGASFFAADPAVVRASA
ncbi:MAG: hypothetical protein U1D30_16685 [Planctomycetota bacterium]